jgi:glycosyltransferase involved in cell wall biosynthesis
LSQADWSALVIGAVPYQGRVVHSGVHLARELAERRPVLYVEPPHSLARGLRFRPQLKRVDGNPNLATFKPVAFPGYNRSFFGSLSDPVVGAQIRRVLRSILDGHLAVILCTPKFGPLGVRSDVVVYWQLDTLDMLTRRGGRVRIHRRHSRIMRDANVIAAVSRELVDDAARKGRSAALVPNGCDYDFFALDRARPGLLPLGTPIIGFVGGLNERVDLDLLLAIADARPQWQFVIVGEAVVELPRRSNILHIGWQPYSEIPVWMQAFDVGLIPYVQDRRNLASSPLKALEYLAAGTPVVSVPIEGLRGLGDVVGFGNDATTFIRALDQFVAARPAADSCRTVARAHTWARRANEIERLIEEGLGRPG